MFDIVLACLGIANGTVAKRDTVDRSRYVRTHIKVVSTIIFS